MPLAQVRDVLWHASITTAERYDNQTLANLQVGTARLERGLGFSGGGGVVRQATACSESRLELDEVAGFTRAGGQSVAQATCSAAHGKEASHGPCCD